MEHGTLPQNKADDEISRLGLGSANDTFARASQTKYNGKSDK